MRANSTYACRLSSATTNTISSPHLLPPPHLHTFTCLLLYLHSCVARARARGVATRGNVWAARRGRRQQDMSSLSRRRTLRLLTHCAAALFSALITRACLFYSRASPPPHTGSRTHHLLGAAAFTPRAFPSPRRCLDKDGRASLCAHHLQPGRT